ncbi:MAG: SHD1 domain-containing protein [Planctomycetaceae bacterium]
MIAHSRLHVSFARLCTFILFAWASYGFADVPRYQPSVGSSYDYGIECIIARTDVNRSPTRQRCRIEFRVTECNDNEWRATYTTTPFSLSGPLPKPASGTGTSPSQMPVRPPGLPPPAFNFAEARERFERERQALPGWLTHVEGSIRVRSNGECVEHTGLTRMPLLFGAVWAVPLTRLPENDSEASYSSKDVLDLTVLRQGDASTTEAFSIHSYTPSPATDPALFKVERKVELAGGATAGESLRASGNGAADFSLAVSMPESGFVELQSEGLSFQGQPGHHAMRVSFQRLDDWQRDLFDHFMVPTSGALDPQNLPRLSAVQMRELIALVTAKTPPRSLRLQVSLAGFAPPPQDSPLYKSFDTTLGRMANSPAAQADGRVRDMAGEMDRVFKHWQTVYRLATKVPRQWTDATGAFKVQATLVDRTVSDVRLVRIDNRQTIALPIARLSASDQEIVNTFATMASP